MRELRLPIRRSARYYTLGEPKENTRAIWIVCHGYGQLAGNFLNAFTILDNGRNLIVAPKPYPDSIWMDLQEMSEPPG